MTLAAVVVCRDQGRALDGALAALAAQTPAPVEIVVVDDGSADLYTRQALATLCRPGLAVHRVARGGAARALDAGIALTSAPWILALDTPDHLPPGWVAAALNALASEPAAGFVAPGVPFAPSAATLLARGAELRAPLVRRALWQSLGGFAGDAALEGLVLADFALTALARGAPGIAADAPAVVTPRRPPPAVAVQQRLRERHAALVAALGPELVLAKEAWLMDVRARRGALERASAAEAHALAEVREEIDRLVAELAAAGRGRLEWGDLRRVTPLSAVWGIDRGRPMDRYFIERFLERHRADVRDRVLEVKDAAYTRIFGGDAVTESQVLDVDPVNPEATLVADLTQAETIPAERFDCVILTQTLHIIYDMRAALRHARRLLAPGGVLLCTLPALGRISNENGGLDGGDHWRFTEASVRRLFAEVFAPEEFSVEVAGNVLVAAAFLYGMSPHELTAEELDHVDPWHPLLFSVRAVKAPRRCAAAPAHAGLVLLYHRVAAVESDAAGLAAAPEAFRAQMEHLRRAWRPMPLAELAAAAAAGDVPERAVAVTLDDGYADALATVSPILRALGIPATFFVVADALEHEREFWWDTLERVLLGPHALPPVLDVALDGGAERFGTATATDRAATWRRVNDWMVRAAAGERAARLAEIVAWSGLTLAPRGTHRPMTRAELRELAAHPGHAIGAHGAHHLLLPEQPLAAAIQEVLEGKAAVEAALGRPVTAFAYPYGGHDATVVDVARAARFDVAVTTDARAVQAGDDPLRLPRLDLSRLDAGAFSARLQDAVGVPKRP